jgi:hypothetical protein
VKYIADFVYNDGCKRVVEDVKGYADPKSAAYKLYTVKAEAHAARSRNHDQGGIGMDDKKKCCGTCRWHKHEDIDDGWVCVNDQSEYCPMDGVLGQLRRLGGQRMNAKTRNYGGYPTVDGFDLDTCPFCGEPGEINSDISSSGNFPTRYLACCSKCCGMIEEWWDTPQEQPTPGIRGINKRFYPGWFSAQGIPLFPSGGEGEKRGL